jgi:hypothetical protein
MLFQFKAESDVNIMGRGPGVDRLYFFFRFHNRLKSFKKIRPEKEAPQTINSTIPINSQVKCETLKEFNLIYNGQIAKKR